MYFGSVRFFKHLIITVIVLSIIIPSLLAITFGVQNSKLKRQIAALDSSSSNSVNMQAPIGGGNDTQGNSPVNESSSNSSQESSASSNSDVEDLGYQNLYPDLFVEPTKRLQIPKVTKLSISLLTTVPPKILKKSSIFWISTMSKPPFLSAATTKKRSSRSTKKLSIGATPLRSTPPTTIMTSSINP